MNMMNNKSYKQQSSEKLSKRTEKIMKLALSSQFNSNNFNPCKVGLNRIVLN